MTIETSDQPEAFARFEHEGWERASSAYDRSFGRLTPQSADALLDAAGVNDKSRLVDVCCGPGMVAGAATARGARVTGLDFSAAAITLARSRVDGAEFIEGDAQALPFDDAEFDGAVCGFGLIHLPDAARGLAEMVRVVRPGGRIAVSVWEPPSPGNGFGLLYDSIRAHADLNVDLPHGPDFFQFSDDTRMTELLRDAGLQDIGLERAPQFWVFNGEHALHDELLESTVRARGLILAQTPAVQARIRAAVIDGMGTFRAVHNVYRVPMPAMIGAGVKP